MEAKCKTSSTEFEKHPDPRNEESREAFRQKWGYNPAMPHVAYLHREYWGDAAEQREEPETTEVLK
jgi:hypothetical protein